MMDLRYDRYCSSAFCGGDASRSEHREIENLSASFDKEISLRFDSILSRRFVGELQCTTNGEL